jgi:hypothetical protein
MNVAVQLEFKGDRKEPLGALIRRVAAQFEQNGVQPTVLATFSDGPGGIRPVSAVERAIKKHPHLSRFELNDSPMPAAHIPPIRRLASHDPANAIAMTDILALADGVPRSLPFHAVTVHFNHADFGRAPAFMPGLAPPMGILISDGWWVNGRMRGLSAFYAVEAEATSKKLPEPPSAIAAVLSGLGKPRKKSQFAPAPAPDTEAAGVGRPSMPKDVALIMPVVTKYRANLKAVVERAGLPNDLPPAAEARLASVGASGPLKPALVDAFKPRGFDCKGGHGTFTLQRRTKTNHVVELELDVGTWSRSLTFMFHVRGPAFNATLMPPVTRRDDGRQYPIGDTENWAKIVANLAAIVDELERTFVREIEAAVGEAPAWFEPGR